MTDHPLQSTPHVGQHFKILSWNLLRQIGATLDEVVALAQEVKPDIFLMQEAVSELDRVPEILGGHYARIALPGRIHGTACWSRFPFARPPISCTLPSGLVVRRTAQLIDFGSFSIANVHLSHGQILNRRQLRRIAAMLRPRAGHGRFQSGRANASPRLSRCRPACADTPDGGFPTHSD